MASRRTDRTTRIQSDILRFTSLGYAIDEGERKATLDLRASQTESREGVRAHLEGAADRGSCGEEPASQAEQEPVETPAQRKFRERQALKKLLKEGKGAASTQQPQMSHDVPQPSPASNTTPEQLQVKADRKGMQHQLSKATTESPLS